MVTITSDVTHSAVLPKIVKVTRDVKGKQTTTTVSPNESKPEELDITQAAEQLRRLASQTPALQGIEEQEHSSTTEAHQNIRYVQKPDRENPHAEQKACESIQLKIAELKGEIKQVVADITTEQKDTAEAKQRKESLRQSLQGLSEKIAISIEVDESDYKTLQRFKNNLHRKRKEISAKFKELGRSKENAQARADLNSEAISTNKKLLKVQLKLTELLLDGKSKLKNILWACNTADGALVGADLTCEELKNELGWRANRAFAGAKVREIKALNPSGEEAWTTKLANLDIAIQKDGGRTTTVVSQAVWVNIHNRLDEIRKDVKRGDITEAREKIEQLRGLATGEQGKGGPIRVLNSQGNIAAELVSLNQAIPTTLVDGQKPDRKIIDDVASKVESIKSIIPADEEHSIQMNIAFTKDIAAGARSRVHALKNHHEDFIDVAESKAYLEHMVSRLRVAVKKKSLSIKEKETIDRNLPRIIEWAAPGRGHVYPKQFVSRYLSPALELIEKGYRLEKEASNQEEHDKACRLYRSAASSLDSAAKQLEKRLGDILFRIAPGTKRKFESLYGNLRDDDIKARADVIFDTFKNKDYKAAVEQIEEIRKNYSPHLSPEPGYIRVSKTLAKIESLVQKANSKGQSNQDFEDIEHFTKLIKADIVHKQNWRIKVFDVDASKLRYVYPPPHITLNGLLGKLGKTWTIVKTWKKREQTVGVTLKDDNTSPIIVAKEKLSKTFTVPRNLPEIS